jgi:hypothetical protein
MSVISGFSKKFCSIFAFSLFIILIASVASKASASTDNTRGDTQGVVELTGSNWLSGNGVDVHSNGNSVNNDTGVSCVTVNGAAGGSG